MARSSLLILILFFLAFVRFLSIDTHLLPETTGELDAVEIKTYPIREIVAERASQLLDQPQSALLAGMVVGSKESLPAEFKKALRDTSTIHIVVVSGQNLTLLSVFILGFAPWIGRKKSILLSISVATIYAYITGLQIPVIRALLMVVAVFLAQLVSREASTVKILILTALAMLIYNPSWIYSISFQLSFMATLGVVVVSPQLVKGVGFLPEFIKNDLLVTLSAQLLTMPVIAIHFHQFSLVGVLVNTLVLWTVPLIMITGGAAVFLSFINLDLGQILILPSGILLTYFVYIVDFFGRKGASIYVPNLNVFFWIGYGLVVIGFHQFLRKLNKDKDNDEANVLSLSNVY